MNQILKIAHDDKTTNKFLRNFGYQNVWNNAAAEGNENKFFVRTEAWNIALSSC